MKTCILPRFAWIMAVIAASYLEASAAFAACARVVSANVVAIDQVYVYNRFGSFNPVGMIYALRRDVVAPDGSDSPGPGNARLREEKRPRPLVLRANVGDCLQVNFTNWLAPSRPENDSPTTRHASVHVNGLQYLDIGSDGSNVGRNGSSLAAPGESRTYTFYADKEGAFLMTSEGALVGGQGNGGSSVLGLFGAVIVEPAGSVWYRSQLTADQLKAAQQKDEHGNPMSNPDGTPRINYGAVDPNGVPMLKMLNAQNELIYGDLYAIIHGYPAKKGTPSSRDDGQFREFVVIMHDEAKAVQAFPELENEPAFHGLKDGMAINYGVNGMGSIVLANRKKIGPSKNCSECKAEESALTSWAQGDPAMIVRKDIEGNAVEALYPDDPSNVLHSYIGDPVKIRNLHAGPAETHVFHLHAHQWVFTEGNDKSVYQDSQTIGPGGAQTYPIQYGGSGNRNLLPGDSIFHCHLYAHFAEGMWGLWRIHDVFEAGTPDRNLPDGEIAGGSPNPAVIPMPGRGMPPMPTYTPTTVKLADAKIATRPAFPGYPFYVAGKAGHRPPQPPLDIEHDGGLPRHIITSVPPNAVTYGAKGFFSVDIHEANIKLLPNDGTETEKAAMQFHAGTFPGAIRTTTVYGWPAAAYPAFTAEGVPASFQVNGQPPKPGAPFAEPCPPGTPERDYRATYLQLPVPMNRYGWVDRQARIIVLNGDVEATLSGKRPAEPLFFRANSGDCINFYASNMMPEALEEDDFQMYMPTDSTGQHIHLVKFDVMGSGGSSDGWIYEDGTFSYEEVQNRIAAANALGGAFEVDGTLDESGSRVQLVAKKNPSLPIAPEGTQTTVQRWWADPLLDEAGNDRTLQTVFTHDHLAPSSHQQHGFYAGLIVEPAESSWRHPSTGEIMGMRSDGGPTSWQADILTRDRSKSFREFALQVADFALPYDSAGHPVNPPNFVEAPLPKAIEHLPNHTPEAISAGDPGTMVVNYRNEPIPLRIASKDGHSGEWKQKDGAPGDMANVFRSDLHGDPSTPLLRGYEGDRVVIRLLQGAQEEQHVFSLHGHKWLKDIADPDSGYVNFQPLGISEHFEFELTGGIPPVKNAAATADYLYKFASTDDLWNGTWGILRAYEKRQPDLLPLPNNALSATHRRKPMHPCPKNAKERTYKVHAITAKGNLPGDRLVYNEKFDLYDPDAILFIKSEHLADVKSGRRKPEPLILRASAGECLVVTLVNELPEEMPKTPHWNYNPPIIEGFNTNQVRSSNHVSLHPQLVAYDVNEDDGANVGFNKLQTIPPGKERVYRWYAGEYRGTGTKKATPIEFGVINLRDMADVVNHGMHGAVGALVIEPEDATWKTDRGTDTQATVITQSGRNKDFFREFVLVLQDEVGMHSGDSRFQAEELNSGTALRNWEGADDAEDTGHKAFNYRSEPLWARAGIPPHKGDLNDHPLESILSSTVHGDPATPIFKAKSGDNVRFRLVSPSGHPRQHAFTIYGSEWAANSYAAGSNSSRIGENPLSRAISTQTAVSTMTAWNIVPYNGAGGLFKVPGDFLYRDQVSLMFAQGVWGIFRVGDNKEPERP